MKYIFFLSLPLYALDRISKHLVLNSIDPDRPIVVIPKFFDLVNITNTGAAFGSFKSGNSFFIAISCAAALLALVLLLARPKPGHSADTKSVWLASNGWRDVSLSFVAGRRSGQSDRPIALRARD